MVGEPKIYSAKTTPKQYNFDTKIILWVNDALSTNYFLGFKI